MSDTVFRSILAILAIWIIALVPLIFM